MSSKRVSSIYKRKAVVDALVTFIGFILLAFFTIRISSGDDIVVALFEMWAGTWLIRSRGLFT